jgi:CPA2 family monovalent cation:H+ antiporter-2
MLPDKWNRLIEMRSTRKQQNMGISNEWLQLLKTLLAPMLIYFILALATAIFSKMFLQSFITTNIVDIWGRILFAAITILLMTPFLYGIIRIRTNSSELYLKILKKSNHFNRIILLLVSLVRTILCILLLLLVLIPLFPRINGILIIVSIIVLIFISVNPRYEFNAKKLENVFLGNLNNKYNEDSDENV